MIAKGKEYFCSCGCNRFDKGRAMDGRRAYRCKQCGSIHTSGMQERKQMYSTQRESYQFADSKGYEHVS